MKVAKNEESGKDGYHKSSFSEEDQLKGNRDDSTISIVKSTCQITFLSFVNLVVGELILQINIIFVG